jgi:hypothetical protein
MTAWNHSRKGRMEGRIVYTSPDGVWVDIELAADHQLTYMAASNRGRTDYKGEVIRVRKSHLTELEDRTTA